MTSSLDPLQLGLVLAGQSLGLVKELPLEPKLETNVAGIEAAKEAAGQVGDATAMEVNTAAEVPASPAREKGELEIRGVSQTLDKILLDSSLGLLKAGPFKVFS